MHHTTQSNSSLNTPLDGVEFRLSRIERMLERILPSTAPALRAMNDTELAKHYDVDRVTVYRWRKRGWLDENNVLLPKEARK